MNISTNIRLFILVIFFSCCYGVRDVLIGILYSKSNPEDILISRSVHLAFKNESYEDYFRFIVDDITYDDPNTCGDEMYKLLDKNYSLIYTGVSIKCYQSYYRYTNQENSIIVTPLDLNLDLSGSYITNGLFLGKLIFCIYF